MKYIKGIIGGILGGIVASIPWILLYIYGNMLLSILAAVIGYGVNYGYRLFGGRVDHKLPMIITVISLVVVILVTVVIIPMLLIVNLGYPATLENLQLLYSDSSYMSAMIKDLIISIIFTLLGISSLVKQLRAQL